MEWTVSLETSPLNSYDSILIELNTHTRLTLGSPGVFFLRPSSLSPFLSTTVFVSNLTTLTIFPPGIGFCPTVFSIPVPEEPLELKSDPFE